MQKRIMSGLLAVVVLLSLVATASAQGDDTNPPPPASMRDAAGVGTMNLPGGGWWTGMQVVNVGTKESTVVMTLYDRDSPSTYESLSHVLDPNESYTFYPTDDAEWDPDVPSGFIGSAVVTASELTLAIVNEQNNLGTTGVAGGSYRGFTDEQTGGRLLFPLVKRAYGSGETTTTFFIQNASGASASIYATFRVAAGTYKNTYTGVGANQMVTINPGDAGVPQGSTSLGSLEITSTVKLAGVYNEHEDSATLATKLLGTTGFSEAVADTRLFVPIYKQNYNTSYAGLQVQNVGEIATTIYATYTVAYGGSGTYTANAPADPGESALFFNVSGWPAGTYGAVTVSAAQPLVGIVNETKYSTGQSGVYAAFPESGVTTCAVAPLWKTRWSGGSSGQQSALVVQNVGDKATTVNVEFTMTTGGVGTFTPAGQSLDPGKSLVFGPGAIAGGPPSGTPAVGSVEVCTAGLGGEPAQPIAVLVQETTLPGWTTRDLLNYEAFNK